MKVAVCPDVTMSYPEGAGHLWAYLSWALGLRDLGVEVVWLEAVLPDSDPAELSRLAREHLGRLSTLGLDTEIALFTWMDDPLPPVDGCVPLESTYDADLLLNFGYEMPASIVSSFRRSALVDIDPGLLQIWIAAGEVTIASHDVYFTVGETVGTPEARFPDCGIDWQYVPRPIHLGSWTIADAPDTGAYTTVSHWWGEEWITVDGRVHDNSKRAAFLDYLDLPAATSPPLELALLLDDDDEIADLERRGWRIQNPWGVARTPEDYREYIRGSRGEFSCAKRSCALLANAWVSDRTLAYLATGRPAVVEHTGASGILPDAEGLFRFRSPAEAAWALDAIEGDYEHHARAARALAEEHFDAVDVMRAVLRTALA
jgi:hypothetical protein